MKNKVCYILLSLLVSFSFMNNVFAENITISAVANNNQVVKGEKASIMIKLTANKAIASCLFVIESDDNIVYNDFSTTNVWSASVSGQSGILVESPGGLSTDVPNNLGILQVNYTVNGSGKVTIKTEQCVETIDHNNAYKHDDIVVNFTAIEQTDDTTLSSLSISGANPPIELQPNSFVYGTSITSPNFSLSMTTSNPDYQNKIVVKDDNGTEYNPDNITFKAINPDESVMILYIYINDKKTYTLSVTYEQKDLDNSLSSIKINGTELTLENDKVDYEFEVGSDVNSVLVEATLKDSNNFQISNSNILANQFNIVDRIDIEIIVAPKEGVVGATSKTYTVVVKKKSNTKPSDDDDDNNGGNPNNNGNNNSDGGNVNNNPGTGDISMFIMAFILIASLVGSVVLYQKNLESYK